MKQPAKKSGAEKPVKSGVVEEPETACTWLVVCVRCDKPKAPRGKVPVNDSEAKDYCLRDCPGYEAWPHPTRLPEGKDAAS